MDKCTSCKFYTSVPFWKPTCRKLPDIRLDTHKVKYFELPAAFKICKGYFYEHKDSDLYKTKDDSLCGEKDIDQ